MRKILFAAAIVFTLGALTPAPAVLAVEGAQDTTAVQTAPPPLPAKGGGMHRIGIGVNYWKAIEDLDEDVNHDGFSYLVSYQYAPVWFVKIGTNLELFPDLANSGKAAWEPELYVTFGGLLYAGVGIGMYYFDGDWGSKPFYAFRAGFDIPVLPRLYLDINANYRFNDWDNLEWSDLGTDTIHLGAAVRFAL